MAGISTDENPDIKLRGDSDETLIGNVGDRLKVDAAYSIAPPSKIVHSQTNVLNSGSSSLAVDGSTTPVVFTAGPPSGETWYITELGIVIEDSGNNTVDRYGALTALTNGTLIEQVVDSTAYTFSNLFNNIDIVESFTDHSFRGVANAFLNSPNFFTGKVSLKEPVTLVGNNSDVIKVTVRDNVTGLDQHRISIEYFKVLP